MDSHAFLWAGLINSIWAIVIPISRSINVIAAAHLCSKGQGFKYEQTMWLWQFDLEMVCHTWSPHWLYLCNIGQIGHSCRVDMTKISNDTCHLDLWPFELEMGHNTSMLYSLSEFVQNMTFSEIGTETQSRPCKKWILQTFWIIFVTLNFHLLTGQWEARHCDLMGTICAKY